MTPQELVQRLASDQSEHSQQSAIFAWAALPDVRERYPLLKWMFAIPNGFYSTAGQKGKMKAEGLRSGVPDIFLPVRRNDGACGMFLEMKSDRGKLSSIQSEWLTYLITQGYHVAVAYSFEEATTIITRYLEV